MNNEFQRMLKLAGIDSELKINTFGERKNLNEGLGAYEYEKGKKAGEKMAKSKLRKKIREMVLAEMDGAAVEDSYYDPVDEAKKKSKDDDEDIDIEDIDIEEPDMEEPSMETGGGDDPEVERILDLLDQLQDAAEKLKDDKLLHQIGNTITFFTRQHVAEPDINPNA
jgi:hypothetical protein